ncbi:MAG: hypothetical protein AAGI46_16870 [Planctomycetota bacterium]
MTDSELSRFIATDALVCIRREAIDQRSMQAFVLAFSESHALTRYVYDFHVDGHLLLRRRDITAVECRRTDQFQRELLVEQDALDAENNRAYPKTSFLAALDSLEQDELVIVECEEPDHEVFAIGRYAGRDEHGLVRLHEFSGAGSWNSDLSSFDPDDITCCSFGGNYIRSYQRYFDRVGFPKLPRR